VDLDVLSDCPAQLLQSLQEGRVADLCLWVVRVVGHEHADAAHTLASLRARRERPRSRPAEKSDELAPSHSITSSARASSLSGTVKPSAFVVLRLIAR